MLVVLLAKMALAGYGAQAAAPEPLKQETFWAVDSRFLLILAERVNWGLEEILCFIFNDNS